jgi:hypothetical protein
MMDAFLAIIFDGVRAICQKQSSSRIKLIKQLFYCFLLNQAKAFLPNPFQRGCPSPIRRTISIVNTPYEGQTAPPWWWCLWDCCVRVDGTFHTIHTVGILWGGSFCSCPNPYRGIHVNIPGASAGMSGKGAGSSGSTNISYSSSLSNSYSSPFLSLNKFLL